MIYIVDKRNEINQVTDEREGESANLKTEIVVNGGTADISGFLAWTDGVDGNSVGLECLERNHGLVVLHEISAEQENPLLNYRHNLSSSSSSSFSQYTRLE